VKTTQLAAMALRGLIPFQPTLRRLKRALSPYQDNRANSNYCITNGLEQLAALRGAGVPVAGATVLEFGSGWLPLIPMLFHLAGARRLILTDIERLMDARTEAMARARITARLDDIAAALATPREALLARLDSFAADYRAPWNPEAHPAEDVDLVISRATFEHVPEDQLRFFLAQFHRILRPGGATCHVIDNSDHWQHKDAALSRVAFLRYEETDWVWRLAQVNTQGFQNRLRHSDYRALLQQAGFRIVLAHGAPDPHCLADLRTLPLATRFRDKPAEDLAILTSLFVAMKPNPAAA
jgi:SAM-dependent methyltransferase